MKKRSLFTLMLVALLAFSLGMGTLAYYTKTFASNDNIVRAARFTVDSGGTLDKNQQFKVAGNLAPGRKIELYEFEIDKKNTEVDVKYKVSLTGKNKLFNENSPVELNLLRKSGEEWIPYSGDEFVAEEKVEKFKIEAFWRHSDRDIDYQNEEGLVDINVVATQVDEDNMPGAPDPVDPELGTVDVKYYVENVLGREVFTGVKITVDDIEGAAKVKFKYEDHLHNKLESKIFSTNRISNFITVIDMSKDITVLVYDKSGTELLHTFENVTPSKIKRY